MDAPTIMSCAAARRAEALFRLLCRVEQSKVEVRELRRRVDGRFGDPIAESLAVLPEGR